MEQATNQFTKGLQCDTHPMVLSNDTLTDCLNGTLITMNGNEVVLLNDMGNRRVDNAFLPPGYEPVGMKEYGGIIYVAAYNPVTNHSQVGSFPSPERKLSPDDAIKLESEKFNFDTKFYGSENIVYDDISGLNFLKNDSFLIPLTGDLNLHVGDKFTVYAADLSEMKERITNYDNIITVDGKKYPLSPKNREFTLQLGILNSQNEFVDITKSLARWNGGEDIIATNIELGPKEFSNKTINYPYDENKTYYILLEDYESSNDSYTINFKNGEDILVTLDSNVKTEVLSQYILEFFKSPISITGSNIKIKKFVIIKKEENIEKNIAVFELDSLIELNNNPVTFPIVENGKLMITVDSKNEKEFGLFNQYYIGYTEIALTENQLANIKENGLKLEGRGVDISEVVILNEDESKQCYIIINPENNIINIPGKNKRKSIQLDKNYGNTLILNISSNNLLQIELNLESLKYSLNGNLIIISSSSGFNINDIITFIGYNNNIIKFYKLEQEWKIINYTNESELYQFNDGYFIPDSFTSPNWENTIKDKELIQERQALPTNTYAYKLVGPLYLKVTLNHLKNFNYTIDIEKNSENKTKIIVDAKMEYNCPDSSLINYIYDRVGEYYTQDLPTNLENLDLLPKFNLLFLNNDGIYSGYEELESKIISKLNLDKIKLTYIITPHDEYFEENLNLIYNEVNLNLSNYLYLIDINDIPMNIDRKYKNSDNFYYKDENNKVLITFIFNNDNNKKYQIDLITEPDNKLNITEKQLQFTISNNNIDKIYSEDLSNGILINSDVEITSIQLIRNFIPTGHRIHCHLTSNNKQDLLNKGYVVDFGEKTAEDIFPTKSNVMEMGYSFIFLDPKSHFSSLIKIRENQLEGYNLSSQSLYASTENDYPIKIHIFNNPDIIFKHTISLSNPPEDLTSVVMMGYSNYILLLIYKKYNDEEKKFDYQYQLWDFSRTNIAEFSLYNQDYKLDLNNIYIYNNDWEVNYHLYKNTMSESLVSESSYEFSNPKYDYDNNLYSINIKKVYDLINIDKVNYILGVLIPDKNIYFPGFTTQGVLDLEESLSGNISITEWRFFVKDNNISFRYGINAAGKNIKNFKIEFINKNDDSDTFSVTLQNLGKYITVNTINISSEEYKWKFGIIYKCIISYTEENIENENIQEIETIIDESNTPHWLLTTELFNDFYSKYPIYDFCDLTTTTNKDFVNQFLNKMFIDIKFEKKNNYDKDFTLNMYRHVKNFDISSGDFNRGVSITYVIDTLKELGRLENFIINNYNFDFEDKTLPYNIINLFNLAQGPKISFYIPNFHFKFGNTEYDLYLESKKYDYNDSDIYKSKEDLELNTELKAVETTVGRIKFNFIYEDLSVEGESSGNNKNYYNFTNIRTVYPKLFPSNLKDSYATLYPDCGEQGGGDADYHYLMYVINKDEYGEILGLGEGLDLGYERLTEVDIVKRDGFVHYNYGAADPNYFSPEFISILDPQVKIENSAYIARLSFSLILEEKLPDYLIYTYKKLYSYNYSLASSIAKKYLVLKNKPNLCVLFCRNYDGTWFISDWPTEEAIPQQEWKNIYYCSEIIPEEKLNYYDYFGTLKYVYTVDKNIQVTIPITFLFNLNASSTVDPKNLNIILDKYGNLEFKLNITLSNTFIQIPIFLRYFNDSDIDIDAPFNYDGDIISNTSDVGIINNLEIKDYLEKTKSLNNISINGIPTNKKLDQQSLYYKKGDNFYIIKNLKTCLDKLIDIDGKKYNTFVYNIDNSMLKNTSRWLINGEEAWDGLYSKGGDSDSETFLNLRGNFINPSFILDENAI